MARLTEKDRKQKLCKFSGPLFVLFMLEQVTLSYIPMAHKPHLPAVSHLLFIKILSDEVTRRLDHAYTCSLTTCRLFMFPHASTLITALSSLIYQQTYTLTQLWTKVQSAYLLTLRFLNISKGAGFGRWPFILAPSTHKARERERDGQRERERDRKAEGGYKASWVALMRIFCRTSNKTKRL